MKTKSVILQFHFRFIELVLIAVLIPIVIMYEASKLRSSDRDMMKMEIFESWDFWLRESNRLSSI